MTDIPAFYGDGVKDCTPVFNAAVQKVAPFAGTIRFPPGAFRFLSRPAPIPTGITLKGDGSVGPSPGGYGTSLVSDYDETDSEAGFLTWNGAGAPNGRIATGGGGGICNLRILKGSSHNGGNAVKLTGTLLPGSAVGDDGRRCVRWTWFHCMIAGIDATGLWDRAVLVDGMAWRTPSGQGIRSLKFFDVDASWARLPGKTFEFRNTVDCRIMSGFIYPAGSGASNQGVYFTGSQADLLTWNNYPQIDGLHVIGTLTLDCISGGRVSGMWTDINITKAVTSVKISGTCVNVPTQDPNAKVVIDATKF